MKHEFSLTLLAGLLPIVAVNLAFVINIHHGVEPCIPYLDGCISVSRGIRSGPGLLLFKLLAPVCAALMWFTWQNLPHWPWWSPALSAGLQWVVRLGKAGSLFFLVYALWLGTDGEVYRWLRRYGVVLFFGLTGLAHLLLWAKMARHKITGLPWRHAYGAGVFATWAVGISSAFKRNLTEDTLFLDRVENALEWNFALFLLLGFVVLAFLRRSLDSQSDDANQRSVSGQR